MEFTNDIYFNINPEADSDLKIQYKGFLNQSSELWIVYGFDEAWNNTSEVKMEKNEYGFEATIKVLDFKTFNFCFKNGNNEWDNNNSCNYISAIEPSYNSKLYALFDELFDDEVLSNKSIETESVEEFDIDKLIDEILQPIVSASSDSFTDEELESNVISENYIEFDDETNDELNIELTEDKNEVVSAHLNTNEIILDSTEENEQSFDIEDVSSEYTNEDVSSDDVLSTLVAPQFAISPRKLSRFYLFRKKLKILAYKLARLPQLLFGE